MFAVMFKGIGAKERNVIGKKSLIVAVGVRDIVTQGEHNRVSILSNQTTNHFKNLLPFLVAA